MSDQTAQSDSTTPSWGAMGVPQSAPPGPSHPTRRTLLRAAGAGAGRRGWRRAAPGLQLQHQGRQRTVPRPALAPVRPGHHDRLDPPADRTAGRVRRGGQLGDLEDRCRPAQYKNGFKVGGKTYSVTIKSYDTQSSDTRAGDLAHQAILTDGVDLLLASSTPETVNAVASTAETLGTPLICANCPWEAWYLNLFPNGNPHHANETAKYVVLYFLGAEHLVECFIPMWNRIHSQLHTDKVVAAALPQRLRRQRLPRGVPADRQGGRVQHGRCPRPTPTARPTTPR